MEAKKLVYEGETEARAWVCTRCGWIHNQEAAAEGCCKCRTCGTPLPKMGSPQYGNCDECLKRRRELHPWELAKKAERLPIGSFEMLSHPFREHFVRVEELDELVEYEDLPPFMFGTEMRRVALDIESILDAGLDDHHEDAEWDATGELEEFLKGWNAKQRDRTYDEVQDKIVVLDEEKFEAKIAELLTQAEADRL